MPTDLLIVLAIMFGLPGCRLCCNDGELDYAAFGGAWQRTHRAGGRVGSLFDPAGHQGSMLESRETPVQTPDLGLLPPDTLRELDGDDEDSVLPDLDDLDDPSESDGDEPTPDADDLKDLDLEDIEDDATEDLRDLKLEDIEVKIVPRRDVVS